MIGWTEVVNSGKATTLLLMAIQHGLNGWMANLGNPSESTPPSAGDPLFCPVT
jgi:hypothetical protein